MEEEVFWWKYCSKGGYGWHVVLITEQGSYDTYMTPMIGQWQQSEVQRRQHVEQYLATFARIEQTIMVATPALIKVMETRGVTTVRYTCKARTRSGQLKGEVDQGLDTLLAQLPKKMSKALKKIRATEGNASENNP